MRPLVGRSKPAIMRSVVVLPQPDGPSIVKNSPRRHLQVDAVDGDDVAEALGQLLELDLSLHQSHLQAATAAASLPPAKRR